MNDSTLVPRGLIRQGDLLLVPVADLPEDARVIRRGRLVLARGEATGHAHVVEDDRAFLHDLGWAWAGDEVYLSVVGDAPVSLVHEEHDTLVVSPGVYEVRRQREYAPRERFRRVSD
jgi:hypothetical protein